MPSVLVHVRAVIFSYCVIPSGQACASQAPGSRSCSYTGRNIIKMVEAFQVSAGEGQHRCVYFVYVSACAKQQQSVCAYVRRCVHSHTCAAFAHLREADCINVT